MLRLIHLSDIHLGGYGPEWDDDEDQREQLIIDVGEIVANDGQPADGILIGGDLGFSGSPEEYERVALWLDGLIDASGCPTSAIWTVPGNHDIDRRVVKSSPILTDFRTAIRASELAALDETLRARLALDEAAAGLIQPFKAYNDLALRWGCATSANPVHWSDDTLRVDNTTVLLWGVNSALVSDERDAGGPVGDPNLVVGTYQSKLRALPGQVRLVLCHHPPTWLRDWEAVAPYLARAHVILFGHEHVYSAYQPVLGRTLHVHAGAVAPDRGAEWVPSYNLISMAIEGDVVVANVRPRVWSTNDTRFVAHLDDDQDFRIALERLAAEMAERDETSEGGVSEPGEQPSPATPLAPETTPGIEPSEAPIIPGEDAARLRALAVGYLTVPITRRLEIARVLGVLEDEDIALPDERAQYSAILKRIRDSGLIDALARELDL